MKILINIFVLSALLISFIGFSSTGDKSVQTHKNEYSKFSGVKSVSQTIHEKKMNSAFEKVRLFDYKGSISGDGRISDFVNKGVLLNLNKSGLHKLFSERSENISMSIPVSENEVTLLELTRSYPLDKDFSLLQIDKTGKKKISCSEGIHYSGIIGGDEKSLVSLSIFENSVMGLICNDKGNYNLGPVKNGKGEYTDNYILYNDADRISANKFKCALEDNEEKFIKPVNETVKGNLNDLSDDITTLPVKVYFEADYKMYLDNGSNTQNTANFISAMFNSVKTIYQNENIPITISSVGIWTASDPYDSLNDSYEVLLKFGQNSRDDFNGNLAHLLSTRPADLGGIAWIRVLCAQYNSADNSGRYAFSNIENSYQGYPTYSWTVNVVTHEMGHNLGSRHTHACVWPTSTSVIGAIDSCYNAEGSCFTTLRPRVGTIMSYCHLWTTQQGGGINLSSGFGPLPGDTIRLRYSQAGCLIRETNSSEPPATFDLSQNYPNPFNPSTTIKFDIPKETFVSIKVYDNSGRMVANLVNNKFYAPGFYDVRFNSSEYSLSSGIYFYKLVTPDFTDVKRMVLIK